MNATKLREPWPPIEFCLPNLDTLEEISRGQQPIQRELFSDLPDDSRDGRIARLCETIDSVRTANQPNPPIGVLADKATTGRA